MTKEEQLKVYKTFLESLKDSKRIESYTIEWDEKLQMVKASIKPVYPMSHSWAEVTIEDEQ